jgi:hypothetical protein
MPSAGLGTLQQLFLHHNNTPTYSFMGKVVF